MNTQEVIKKATKKLYELKGSSVDIIEFLKPKDVEYALNIAKILSKVSPLIGNLIELEVVSILNSLNWNKKGRWIRQDPGFPDTLFDGVVIPKPGFEIKTWYPLSTEITARFKDSVTHFAENQTYVAVIVWLPEKLIYGKPKILDVWIGSAKSLANARDAHYNNPPDYLVIEPEDTTARTQNLQQTNTNGYKFQGKKEQLDEASRIVKSWGKDYSIYSPSGKYQTRIKSLLGKYPYRLDTNFAKIDRIEHGSLESFKTKIYNSTIYGKKISDWSSSITTDKKVIEELLGW